MICCSSQVYWARTCFEGERLFDFGQTLLHLRVLCMHCRHKDSGEREKADSEGCRSDAFVTR